MNLSTILSIGLTAAAQTSPAVMQTSPAPARTSPTAAQTSPVTEVQQPAPPGMKAEQRSAHQAVREGNRQLLAGQPSAALEAYKHAEQIVPDAREIAFVEGLAHFDLEDFDAARDAFHRVGAFDADALADDALYSLGACDHAEALRSVEENPQLALSQLESAMQRYQDLLTRRPDHKHARDENYKAASMWQELKRQMEQQQQEQQQDCDKEGDEENEQQKQDQSQDEKDKQEKEQDKQSQQNEQEQSDEQEKQQQASEQQQEKDEKQQQSEAQKQEQVSREQAQRKLREMMQAIRDRKKQRRQQVQKVPVTPVDKDW